MSNSSNLETVCANCGEKAIEGQRSCRSCGHGFSWGKGEFKTKNQEKVNGVPHTSFPPAPNNCQYGNGHECLYPANCSHSTMGGGPYFCRFHFQQSHGAEAARVALESQDKSNREAYHKPVPPKKITKISEEDMKIARSRNIPWALAILEKQNAGQNPPYLALKMAKEVCGLKS